MGRNECHILRRAMPQIQNTKLLPSRVRSQPSAPKNKRSGHHGVRTRKEERGWGSLEVLLAAASMSKVSFLQPHGLKEQGGLGANSVESGGLTSLQEHRPHSHRGQTYPRSVPHPRHRKALGG